MYTCSITYYDINTKICSQPKDQEEIFCQSSRHKKSNQLHHFTQAVIFYELTHCFVKKKKSEFNKYSNFVAPHLTSKTLNIEMVTVSSGKDVKACMLNLQCRQIN